jgi:hypothetical protein
MVKKFLLSIMKEMEFIAIWIGIICDDLNLKKGYHQRKEEFCYVV